MSETETLDAFPLSEIGCNVTTVNDLLVGSTVIWVDEFDDTVTLTTDIAPHATRGIVSCTLDTDVMDQYWSREREYEWNGCHCGAACRAEVTCVLGSWVDVSRITPCIGISSSILTLSFPKPCHITDNINKLF